MVVFWGTANWESWAAIVDIVLHNLDIPYADEQLGHRELSFGLMQYFNEIKGVNSAKKKYSGHKTSHNRRADFEATLGKDYEMNRQLRSRSPKSVHTGSWILITGVIS
jgi:hypothetical protein